MISELSTKILVIEDDNVTRNLYLKGLEAKGFEMIGAQNGVVGIQQAQEHLPDLVICDITMPDMDGYGVLSRIRLNPLTAIIPFIFLTGSDERVSIRKAMEMGADDYLTKPSTLDELLRAIAVRLQRQSLLQYWCTNKLEKVPVGRALALAGDVGIDEFSHKEIVTLPKSIFPSVPQLNEVFDFIEAHYHQGITLSDVAQAVGYSAAYLTNRVARLTGETVNSWIVKRRMVGARFLLQNNNQTIEQIAKALGYQDVSHFSRQFRQHHGLPPHAWRQSHQLALQK